MQQLGRNYNEYFRVYKLESGNRQSSQDFLQRAKATVLAKKTELDFSKLLDKEMAQPV